MVFRLVGDQKNQPFMEKYMRNQFPFLGLRTPQRKAQSQAFIKASKQWPTTKVIATVNRLYQRKPREYQYVAIDVADANVNRLAFSDIKALTQFVQIKSWWDTVDAWRKVFGKFVILHPEQKPAVFALFYRHKNFWMRRVAILLQLLEKQTLDTELLTKAIEFDQTTNEFFIQKAIGWALRNYSKYHPEWVKQFLESHELSKLAVKEGSKMLRR
ncbi:DNA-7-methylguanine glycosylase [Lentilactobacillus fungorum]|uniref:DNA-7-methylguanine glycosylase n=1 Tax=Lentilactobacillus fungorum TaxID=2201250 RepID=A0ABQ3W221_9LACO|nr:DNA alkylation repair protein [Lentilactobacillus fungorum]GHP14880.1 DNA-7-methylguanine glycosylase [Lentilactobacillus fungorum]